VGVDAWNLRGDRRGLGRYARALLREWSTTFKNDVDLTLLVPEWPAWWYAATYRCASHTTSRVRSRKDANAADLDALWFPWNGLSWSANKPKVAVLHDASLFALEMPAAKRAQELIPFRRAVQEDAQIVTDSQFSKRELAQYLNLQPESIEVVVPGVETPAGTEPEAKPKLPFELPYILFVGEFEERKGIDILLAGVARLPSDLRSNAAVVLAGEPRGAQRFESDVPIAILGHVDDTTLGALYRNATVFVYPSRYEGFGLPVLEAMAHGAPVIASNAGGIPEAGGNAARYFESGNPDALAAALEPILRDSSAANDLRIRGKQRALEMRWSKTAGKMLEIISRACKQ
ncbi:MAG: glycosyltransferase family 4 protein, partial [Candidatus Eremiobacteraeota bacterium]|nr:glycosyltransferase family 4 protein [Candidatus Eremiobacteraeota bacterium]